MRLIVHAACVGKCSEENLEQRDDIEDVNLLGYGLDGWSSNPGTDKMGTRVLSRC